MLWVLKRTGHPKHMIKLMGKEIFSIFLGVKILYILTYEPLPIPLMCVCEYLQIVPGAYVLAFYHTQWLSGRVLDSRLRGRRFEPHRSHCVVSLSKNHLSLLSTCSTQEDPSQHN